MANGRPAGWLLDERASAGRENLDEDHVARYDDKENAGAATEVALLRTLGLDETSTVIDLGAGTGQFTLAVARHCARVVAVDVSPVMQRVLRRKVAGSGLANIECVTSGFLTYEHRGDPVDFAYSRYALHHLPDFWKALALTRIADIMRRGAVLRLWDIVYSFDPHQASERIESWCATLSADTADSDWNRGDIEEHVRDEHSTFSWLLEPMIERAGFGIDHADYSDDGILAKYIARKR